MTFDKYAELQHMLLLMSQNEDIISIKNYINNNNLLKNQKKSLSTVRLIASIAYTRPKLFGSCINLLKMLENIDINKSFFYFKLVDKEIGQRIITMYLLFKLSGHLDVLDDEYLSCDEFINPINYFHGNDFYRYNEKNNFDSISQMTDEKIIESRNKLHSTHPLSQAIIDDNVDLLQKLISQNNYDINDHFFDSYFEINPFLQESSLLEYSCFYGSVKCFKFLFNKVEQTDIDAGQLIKYAISGGNYEIIHIVESLFESNNSYPDDLLDFAILYFQTDLIEYIIENYNLQINAENYIKSIYASNYEAMIKLHSLGDNDKINQFGKNGSTPLDIASFEGYLDFFKYILKSFEKVDPTIKNQYGKTILHSAAKARQADLIKYIIKHDLIDPRIKSLSGYTAGEFCEFKMGYNSPLVDLFDKAEFEYNKRERPEDFNFGNENEEEEEAEEEH